MSYDRDDATPMTDDEIVTQLGTYLRNALNDPDGDVSKKRSDLLSAYRRDAYGNEREGHSKFVTGEVFETVEWILPDVLEVFTANPRPVEFLPHGPEDEEFAKQETDIVLHMLLRDNNSFLTIHDLFKDALMYPNGYAKIAIEKSEEVTFEEYEELTQEQLLDVLEQDGKEVEVKEYSSQVRRFDPPTPGAPPIELELFDVKVQITETKKRLVFEAWPPEHLLVDPEHMSPDLDDAIFVCGRSQKTYTELCRELKALGVDEDILEEVETSEDHSMSEEEVNRYDYEEETRTRGDDFRDPSTRKYWDNDCYVLIDADGDGKAERRRIRMIGSTIIYNEEVPEQPFISACSIRIPHKHTGYSYAESIEKEQLVSTALMRQLLDNVYALNRMRKFVHGRALDRKGMEALTNPRSSVVPLRGNPREALMSDDTPNMLGDIMPIQTRMDEKTRMRTGVSLDTSLDPSALQRVASEPFLEQAAQKNKRIRMLARIFAELTMKPAMLKAHRMLRRYQDRDVTLKLRGQWVTTMPTHWKERTDLRVNVGLGKVEREKTSQMLFALMAKQMELMPLGLVTPVQLYNTMSRLIESLDLGSPAQFVVDPKSPEYQPPQPPPPDPVQVAQAGALEAQGRKFDAEAQAVGFEAQLKAQTEQAKAKAQAMKAEADARRANASAALEEQKLANERVKLHLEQFKTHKESGLADQEAAAGIQNTAADTELKRAQTLKAIADANRPDPSPKPNN